MERQRVVAPDRLPRPDVLPDRCSHHACCEHLSRSRPRAHLRHVAPHCGGRLRGGDAVRISRLLVRPRVRARVPMPPSSPSNARTPLTAGADSDSRPTAELCGAHQDSVWDLAFDPHGQVLASASNDKSVQFWCEQRPGDKMNDPANTRTRLDAQGACPLPPPTACADAHGARARARCLRGTPGADLQQRSPPRRPAARSRPAAVAPSRRPLLEMAAERVDADGLPQVVCQWRWPRQGQPSPGGLQRPAPSKSAKSSSRSSASISLPLDVTTRNLPWGKNSTSSQPRLHLADGADRRVSAQRCPPPPPWRKAAAARTTRNRRPCSAPRRRCVGGQPRRRGVRRGGRTAGRHAAPRTQCRALPTRKRS